jgi:hypothetical protein
VVVSDGEDADFRAQVYVDQEIREAAHHPSANLERGLDALDEGSTIGKVREDDDRALDGVQEPATEALAPRFVPLDRAGEFALRRMVETNCALHSGSVARSRSRIRFQSSPVLAPERARRARASISASHSSGGCPATSVSRLRSNASATSARSAASR